MTAALIEAAAARDHENPPFTDAGPRHLRPVPRVKTLRRALALTQEEFAVQYRISIGTLRDWEGLRKIAEQFASLEQVGPKFIVDFEEVQDREDRVLLLRDGFEKVDYLLHSLKIR
jgi:putative transcriptional regulator